MSDIFERYSQDAYVVMKGFFPRSVMEPYKAFIEQALENDVEEVLKRHGLSAFAQDSNQKAKELLKDASHIPVKDQQVLLGQFPLHVRLSEAIYPLAQFIGESPVIQQILDSEGLFMHMPPMIRYVPPGYDAAAVPPHQDTSYNRHLSNFITVWTPMVPITDTCGGLIVYEGSQHMPDTVTVEKRADSWLPPIDVSAYTPRQLTDLDVGDVVVLSPRIAHKSAANTSNTIRLSMDLRIFGQRDTSTKHCIDLQRMEVLTPQHA